MAQVYWLIPSMIPLAPRATKPNVTCLPYAMTPRVSPTRSKSARDMRRERQWGLWLGRQLGVLNLRVLMISGPQCSGLLWCILWWISAVASSLACSSTMDSSEPGSSFRRIPQLRDGHACELGYFLVFPSICLSYSMRWDLLCHCHAVLLCLCR